MRASNSRNYILQVTIDTALETIKGIAETLKDVEGTLTDPEADVLAKIEAVTKAVEEYEKNANTD